MASISIGEDFLPLPVRCTARAKSRLRVCLCDGDKYCQECRCRNNAIPGGSVCEFHGGAAPQVKKAAERRVLEQYAQVQDLSVKVLILRLEDFLRQQELAIINGTAPPVYDDKTLLAMAKVAGDQVLTLQGKATTISESRSIDMNDDIKELNYRLEEIRLRGSGMLVDAEEVIDEAST